VAKNLFVFIVAVFCGEGGLFAPSEFEKIFYFAEPNPSFSASGRLQKKSKNPLWIT
jgi:hypothetical protein